MKATVTHAASATRMRSHRRVALLLMAVASSLLVSLVLTGGVLAADVEPTVGGELSAGGNHIQVLSNGNVIAHVVMEAESVSLSTYEFDLNPGQTRELTFTGKAGGAVSATYHALVTGQETATATLSLNLVPRVPETYPFALFLLIGVFLLGFLLAMRRLRPWRWRIDTRAA